MKRILLIAGLIILSFLAFVGYQYYNWFVKSAINPNQETVVFYVQTGLNTDSIARQMEEKSILKSSKSFKKLARLKGLDIPRPGRYVLSKKMSLNRLVNLFKGGLQTPVKMVITPIRTPEDLAGKISHYLELDSISIINGLKSDEIAKSFGFDKASFYTMFLPDTYEIYWTTGLSSLFKRMHNEYEIFWNKKRLNEAQNLGLNQQEITILASIVYSEQLKHPDEWPIIAGLYLNRLKRGIALQSDPTLIYAKGDFSINRVLDVDKKIDSPYNTYKYAGLPPGPIYSPDKACINAVLNAESNNFIYMCAKPDNSGYHAFSSNLSQHNRNASKYRRWISKQGIYR